MWLPGALVGMSEQRFQSGFRCLCGKQGDARVYILLSLLNTGMSFAFSLFRFLPSLGKPVKCPTGMVTLRHLPQGQLHDLWLGWPWRLWGNHLWGVFTVSRCAAGLQEGAESRKGRSLLVSSENVKPSSRRPAAGRQQRGREGG